MNSVEIMDIHKESVVIARRKRKAKSLRGALYSTVRARLGVTRRQLAAVLGINKDLLTKRELYKQVYSVEELSVLRRLSGLTWEELGVIMDELAK